MPKKTMLVVTEREPSEYAKKIVRYYSDGMAAKDIARMEKVNVRTLEAQTARIKLEFGAENVTNLVAIFLRNKIID